MKRLWKNYVNSYVDTDAVHAECAPASVGVAVLAIAAAIVGASFATQTVGLRHLWVPLAFLGAGGVSTTLSWLIGVRHRNLFMALQGLEFNLYGLPFTSAAAFSKVPAAYAFAGFYAVVLQRYARAPIPPDTTFKPSAPFAPARCFSRSRACSSSAASKAPRTTAWRWPPCFTSART
ncbi:MAG: hypothetical protein MUC50_01705 [Myxococcota bacterium]|nr:hypothetical protein [Myxococcota bacterium]